MEEDNYICLSQIPKAPLQPLVHVTCFMKYELVGIFLPLLQVSSGPCWGGSASPHQLVFHTVKGGLLAVCLYPQQQIKLHTAAPQVECRQHST